MSDYMIFMAACFCLSTVAVFVFAVTMRAAKAMHGIGFTARTNRRNRVVRKQIRSGEVQDNREYRPVDGYFNPSPTPKDTAQNAVSRQTRTQNGEKVGERC